MYLFSPERFYSTQFENKNTTSRRPEGWTDRKAISGLAKQEFRLSNYQTQALFWKLENSTSYSPGVQVSKKQPWYLCGMG